jgi:formylmethanofuran dehydrogenase subunit D
MKRDVFHFSDWNILPLRAHGSSIIGHHADEGSVRQRYGLVKRVDVQSCVLNKRAPCNFIFIFMGIWANIEAQENKN